MTSKQKPIKGHRLHPGSKAFRRPITGQILPYIIRRAETRTGDKANIVILADNNPIPLKSLEPKSMA